MSNQEINRKEIKKQILIEYEESKQIYGAPKIQEKLNTKEDLSNEPA